MTAPADFTQRAREAIVEVVDTLPAIVALTGRASQNIVAAEDLTAALVPMIGYAIGRVQQISATDYRVPVTFTAAAADAATVNALLNAIDGAVTNPKLLLTSYPIDSYRERGDEGRQDAARADDADCFVGSIDISFVGSAVDPIVPTSVIVLPATFNLAVNGTQLLTAQVRDQFGAVIPGAPLTWASSKPTKASIDPVTGLVTWLDGGLMGDSVVFTATCSMVTGTASGTSTGTLAPIRVATTVTVSPGSFSITTDQFQQLTWDVLDQFGVSIVGAPVSFGTTNAAVATVNGTGLVDGVSAGTCDIQVTSGSAVGVSRATVTPVLLPPDAQDALVLAWDAVNGTLVGPAYQLGSTPGADTNDPTFVAGPPARYQFGADDFITFGDVLDAVFTSAAGWTILDAIEVSAADAVASQRSVFQKDASGAGERQFYVTMYNDGSTGGILAFAVNYASQNTNYDTQTTLAPMTAGRHVLGFTFDPSLGRVNAACVRPFVDGALAAATPASNGAGGSIANTNQPLQLGLLNGVYPSVQGHAYFYVYNRPLTPTEHANNRAWLVARGWA